MSYGLTDEGYIAPRAADFLAIVRDGYIERASLALGQAIVVDWDADVFLGTITALMADQLGDLAEAGQAVYDAVDPSNATGLQLDNLALIVGVSRIPATFSTTTMTITGTAGTIITEGRLVEGGGEDGHARWALTEDVTIEIGGTVDVLVQAEEAGEITAIAGAIDTIVTPVDGWTSVTNAADADAGSPRESDADLRKRRQQSLQTSGSRSLNALRANLLEVDGVEAAIVVQNDISVTAIVEGISCTPHSIAVVVHPASLTDAQKKAVARVIYDHIAGGIATNGTGVTSTITDTAGFPQVIRYDFATTLPVTVDVVVELAPGFDLTDVEDVIKDAITDYFLALSVGDAARRLQLYALIATVEGVDAVTTLDLNGFDLDIDPAATVLLVASTVTVTE